MKKKNERIADLKVHFKGIARVYWTTTRTQKDINGKDETVIDVHTATEKYFSIEQSLLKKSAGKHKLILINIKLFKWKEKKN